MWRFASIIVKRACPNRHAVSLPAYFRQHGWHTAANGKVFDVIADSAASWTEPVWSPGDDWFGKEPDGRGEHLQAAYLEPLPSGRSPYFEKLEVADDDYPDGQVAAKSVQDLQRLAQSEVPFFLAVGFRKPHLPFNAPAQYWRPVGSPDEMLPVTWQSPAPAIPDHALHRSPELRGQYDALPFFGDPSDEDAAEIVAAYHAAVRYADAQVGRVLQGLEDSSATANTLVLLLGDHGFLLGEQRMWTKHALFEPALRTPLIISHPSFTSSHEVRSVTDLLDVYPTVVDLAGLKMPAHVEGVSLRPLLVDPTSVEPEEKQSIARWMNGESVRTASYRYSRWFDESGQTLDEMLFDLEADPLEQSNLAGNSEFSGVIADLGASLSKQRSGPVWSEKLDAQYGRWQLASSAVGGVLLLVLAYPVPVAMSLLLFIGVVVFVFLRFRKRRRSIS